MNDPNWRLRDVPRLTVTSPDFADGEPLPQWARAKAAGGEDRTPALEWGDAPEGTRSFAVTAYDPDAPTQSGWWHWRLVNIPATVTSLAQGAGAPGSGLLPDGAVALTSESGVLGYEGSAPPPGHGPHRYFFIVHALDVERLDLDPDAKAGPFGFQLFLHTIARGQIVGTSETPA